MRLWAVRLAFPLIVAASPAVAADFQVPIRLPAGSRINVTVETLAVTNGDGATNREQRTVAKYSQEIFPTSAGYEVRQSAFTQVGSGPNSPSRLDNTPFSYQATGSLKPLRILDFQRLTDRLKGGRYVSMDASGKPSLGPASFAGVTPETAAADLMVPSYLGLAQGMVLDLKKPRQVPIRIAVVPFERQPPLTLDGQSWVELVELDRDVGKAVIQTRSLTDPRTIRVVSGGVVPLSSELRCRFDMSLDSGLATKADCTRIHKWAGYFGGAQVIETRTVILQELTKP